MRDLERESLVGRGTVRRGVRGAQLLLAAAIGAAALVLLASGALDGGGSERDVELIQMGVGAEAENDGALINALGTADGDISAEVKQEVQDAVKQAQEETQAAADEEIDAAVQKGKDAAAATFKEDLAKYRGQEADMGHTGWVDSFTTEEKSVSHPQQLHQMKIAQAHARSAGVRVARAA